MKIENHQKTSNAKSRLPRHHGQRYGCRSHGLYRLPLQLLVAALLCHPINASQRRHLDGQGRYASELVLLVAPSDFDGAGRARS